jgi:hypothetical protein
MSLFMFFYGVRALSGGLLGIALMEMAPSGSRIGLIVASAVMLLGSTIMMLSSRGPARQEV